MWISRLIDAACLPCNNALGFIDSKYIEPVHKYACLTEPAVILGGLEVEEPAEKTSIKQCN